MPAKTAPATKIQLQKQCTHRLYIQETSNPHNKVRVQCTMMMIYSLLATSTDDEIIEKILDLELVKVSNDSQNNKVIYIDQIKV